MAEENNKFKVNDRRLFDTDGTEREDAKSEESANKVETDDQKEVSEQSKDFAMQEDVPGEADQEEILGINFASFVASLGTQALMLMGEIEMPEGMNAPVDPKAAKQTIDIIKMLQDKTKGNLDEQESYFIEEMLHNLRVAFLKHS